MSFSVVKAMTTNHFELFYTGNSDATWLCETMAEAFTYGSLERAQAVAERLNVQFAAMSLRFFAVEYATLKD